MPDDSTLSGVLAGIDADALDVAVCRWLLDQADRGGAAGDRGGRQDFAGQRPAGTHVHLLAALDQAEQIMSWSRC